MVAGTREVVVVMERRGQAGDTCGDYQHSVVDGVGRLE